MTLNSGLAALLVLSSLSGVIAGTATQSPTHDKDPVQIARTAVEQALAANDIPKALQTYEQVRGKDPQHTELLRSIAIARANQLRKDVDPRIRVDACAAVLVAARDRSCIDELTTLANDASVDVGSRLAAAVALREAKAPGGDRLFEYVLGQAVEQSPSTAADILSRLPPPVSREALKRLAADSPNADARYIATMALSRLRGDDLIPVLRFVANDKSAAAARLPASIGLARNGDAEGLKVLNETLPYIRGRERIEAALTLVALKDPRGLTLLAEVAKGEHEIARVDAAEAMFASSPKEAEALLTEALKSGNPWVRVRAIRAITSLGMPQSATLRRALVDSNTSIAAAASRAALLDVTKTRR
jgi:HEAT repeat protein